MKMVRIDPAAIPNKRLNRRKLRELVSSLGGVEANEIAITVEFEEGDNPPPREIILTMPRSGPGRAKIEKALEKLEVEESDVDEVRYKRKALNYRLTELETRVAKLEGSTE